MAIIRWGGPAVLEYRYAPRFATTRTFKPSMVPSRLSASSDVMAWSRP